MTTTETKTTYVITKYKCYYAGDLDFHAAAIENAELCAELWTTKPELATKMPRNLVKSLTEKLSAVFEGVQAKRMTTTTTITVESLEDD